jgi:hypothetical protein
MSSPTPPPTSLTADQTAPVLAALARANRVLAERFPGDATGRQPVHVVYGGAHLFKADTTAKLGARAREAFAAYGRDAATLAAALPIGGGDDGELARAVFARVEAKLAREAIEDFRIDFEDGFGIRPHAEEDAAAAQSAREAAKALAAGGLPPFVGIRVKTLSEELKARAVRTLDVFLTAFLDATGGRLPPVFLVTLPKITSADQITAFCDLLALAEQRFRLPADALRLEIMIETPQALLDADGASSLPRMARAGGARLFGAHLGAYDYTSSLGITAASQRLDHPACDVVRDWMQIAFAGQPIFLSDGATNVMPIGPHRGAPLTPTQVAENAATVHAAWRLAYANIRRALSRGYYQGWDLHPAQVPARYAAVYTFFLEALPQATQRLKAFIAAAARASLVGDVFDDAATGQGLLNFFVRGLACGAITPAEAQATGLTLDELGTGSFLRILDGRRLLGSYGG